MCIFLTVKKRKSTELKKIEIWIFVIAIDKNGRDCQNPIELFRDNHS